MASTASPTNAVPVLNVGYARQLLAECAGHSNFRISFSHNDRMQRWHLQYLVDAGILVTINHSNSLKFSPEGWEFFLRLQGDSVWSAIQSALRREPDCLPTIPDLQAFVAAFCEARTERLVAEATKAGGRAS